jgi:cyclohexadieny/prephenate dehydrogenase
LSFFVGLLSLRSMAKLKRTRRASSSKRLFRQITILGPGLLGGSIGLAVREHKLAGKVVAWGRRIESARAAVKCGAADVAALTPGEAVANSDLVILCTPVGSMLPLAREFRSKLSKGCIVTDVGSTKYDVVKHLSTLLSGRATFIGSHPMAGAEKDGLSAAKAKLFEGAVCILTPLPRTRTVPLKKLADFWQSLGCSLKTTSPAEHDEIVSYVSHLPHLVAAALVNLVGSRKAEAFNFIGNGFRDMTRIASGPPEMWAEIVMTNREEIRRCVDRMIDELESIRRNIANQSDIDIRSYLRRAREQREELKHRF